jgi:hypothetical protein
MKSFYIEFLDMKNIIHVKVTEEFGINLEVALENLGENMLSRWLLQMKCVVEIGQSL